MDMDEEHVIFVEDLARIAAMLKAITEAEASEGDCQFNGKLEVVSAPDSVGGKLVGWIQPYDDTWAFAPCLPQLYWSQDRNEWVSLAEIRQEVEATRTRELGTTATPAATAPA